MLMTKYIFEQGRSIKGGWGMKQLSILGIYELKKGWQNELIGKDFPKEVIEKFLKLTDSHIKKSERDLLEKENSIVKQIEQKKSITCYFDGACEPRNPGGNMGIGAIIFEDGEIIDSISFFVQANNDNSNNVAEYMAIEWVLTTLISLKYEKENIKIFGDSKLVIEQMKGFWRIKEGRYVHVAKRCKLLIPLFSNLKLKWIPREENGYADDLSKRCMKDNGVEFRIQPD